MSAKFFLCILMLAFALASTVNAQVTIDVSPPTKLTSKASRFKIIGKNQDGYVVRLYGATDILQSFGNDLRLLATRTIDFKQQNGLLQHIQLNKTGVTVFYLIGDKKTSTLIAQPLSSRFIENGKSVELDSIQDRPEYVRENLRVRQSFNQQYTLFYYPYFEQDKIESISFLCVDRALQKVYSKRVKFMRPDSEMESAKFVVDNNGNAFVFFQNTRERKDRSQMETITVYKLTEQDEDVQQLNITIDRNLFGEMYVDADNANNNLILTGFYDDDNPRNEPAAYGFFYVRLSADSGTVSAVTYTNFDTNFMSELTGKSINENKLYTFNVRRAMLRNDGGILLIAESLIKDTRETIFNSQFSPTFNSIQRISYYQFNDIIAFSVNPDGAVDWRTIMRKKQVSEEDNGIYSSFLTVNERDKIRMLYLDEISTAASLREFVLSSEGKAANSNIFFQESKEVMLLPKAGKQVSPNEVVLPSYMRNQLRIVKLTF